MEEEKRNLATRRSRTAVKVVALVMLAALVALPVAAVAADIPNDYNFGPSPSTVRSQGPTQSLRMATTPIVPGMIKPGFTFVTGLTEASIWGNSPDMLLDFAILDHRVGLFYGLSDRLGFGISLDKRRFIGGNLDQITLNFHEIMGIEQNGRDEVDKYDHRIVRYDGDGSTVLFETREMDQFNSAGITLGSHYVLTYGSDNFMPAIGLTGIVRYGTEAPEGDEDHPVDWSIGTGISKRLAETWYLYGYLSYTSFGQSIVQVRGTTTTPLEWTEDAVNAMLAGAWQFSENWAFILQYQRSEGALEDFNDLSDPSNEINAAFKWQVGEKDALEFTVIENFLNMDNSPDFGFHVAYAHHFGR